jgi:pantetheine-phosphate adenylyltransferase
MGTPVSQSGRQSREVPGRDKSSLIDSTQESTMSAAIYAGSFDPITNGHVSIIRSGLVAFDRIIVAVLSNSKKQALFSAEDRIEMIADAVKGDPRVEVDRFEDGLLVDYARAKGVRVVLRGLRAVGDFEHELQMTNMNRHLDGNIETVFIMASDYFFVSSSLIKEAASLGGDLKGVVPELVEKKLRAKFAEARRQPRPHK